MAIWRKDEKMYTALLDLMRTYLMHDHTPNVEQLLRQQFNEYLTGMKGIGSVAGSRVSAGQRVAS